jgi:hypothetical protein
MPKWTTRGARWALPITAATAALALVAAPAAACGGLVGANGTIKLTRTTTLAAYHDGVERYVTSFEFSGQGKEVGSIVPLPGIPTKVQRGGDWTLQRLEREVAPPIAEFADSAKAATSAGRVSVILQKKIDALDITILKGGGGAVGKWATDHGFLLTADAPQMLDFYASRSPIFMAARFDARRAKQLGQNNGDGTPIMLTIPTKAPWVPLHILSLGLKKSAVVAADVFLLTDARPKLLAGGRGLSLDRDEQANASLLTDLRSDKGMGWLPQRMWFTYLKLDVPAGRLGYDLAVSTDPHSVPSLTAAGVTAAHAHIVEAHHGRALWPLAAAGLIGVAGFGLLSLLTRPFGRRRRAIGSPA